ncbi:hypothetical protein HHI36_007857 [Cryptolaemus montrouzieri]|uniref:Uncharacterized protein n=1 Tax=Cryptolaemus montrouzieri TaxID=559131 RepID=A0ABD2MQT5_9CUCU
MILTLGMGNTSESSGGCANGGSIGGGLGGGSASDSGDQMDADTRARELERRKEEAKKKRRKKKRTTSSVVSSCFQVFVVKDLTCKLFVGILRELYDKVETGS